MPGTGGKDHDADRFFGAISGVSPEWGRFARA